MKTNTHGNGRGLNDLYLLPDNDGERDRITEYLKARGIPFEWTRSDVEGQEWYGKTFIEIPFGEGYLGVIKQALATCRYRCTFTGRQNSAIGVIYPITETVEAETPEAARLTLYDRYEHISGFTAEKV